MLKKILLVAVAVVALFGLYVATRPGQYRIERSVVMNAEPANIFPNVVIFRRWEAWSPWARLDPNMKVEYSGPKGGVGSVYAWKGNDKVGEGRMTMVSALKDQLVDIKLEFLKPWEQKSMTSFTFEPAPGGTKVTWAMTGDHDFVGKLFAVFMNMDQAVGPDFEKGLAALKALAERKQASDD
jgi:hypothetical protein